MSTTVDGLVADYLRRLEAALSTLPAARRKQLVAEIAEHLGEASAQLDPTDEISARELLDRIGRPEDIAAEAGAEQPQRRRRPRAPIAVAAGAAVVLVACLVTALIIGRPASSPTASGRPPSTTNASLTVPNSIGQSSSSAAARLESMGIGVVLVPDPSNTAPAGTVTGQQPAAGSILRPGQTVTLTYVAPATAATAASAAPTSTRKAQVGNVAARSSAVSVSAPPIPSGTYVDGAAGTPHYFVSFTNGTAGAVSGSVDFLYQDGQTAVAFTFTGTTHNGIMTLTPADIAQPAPGRPVLAQNVPSAISATDDHNAFNLGECTSYLPQTVSMTDCEFTYSPNGAAGR